MYRVYKVITYTIRNDKNYFIYKEDVKDELTANFIANALNEQIELNRLAMEEKDKQISELRSVLPT